MATRPPSRCPISIAPLFETIPDLQRAPAILEELFACDTVRRSLALRRMLQQGFKVALPAAATGKRVPNVGATITLTKEHVVYFNNEVVTFTELRQKLAGIKGAYPVFIRSDRYAYVNHLIALWDLCRDMGVRDIHVATVTE